MSTTIQVVWPEDQKLIENKTPIPALFEIFEKLYWAMNPGVRPNINVHALCNAFAMRGDMSPYCLNESMMVQRYVDLCERHEGNLDPERFKMLERASLFPSTHQNPKSFPERARKIMSAAKEPNGPKEYLIYELVERKYCLVFGLLRWGQTGDPSLLVSERSRHLPRLKEIILGDDRFNFRDGGNQEAIQRFGMFAEEVGASGVIAC